MIIELVTIKPGAWGLVFDVGIYEIPKTWTPMPNTSQQKERFDEVDFKSVFTVLLIDLLKEMVDVKGLHDTGKTQK